MPLALSCSVVSPLGWVRRIRRIGREVVDSGSCLCSVGEIIRMSFGGRPGEITGETSRREPGLHPGKAPSNMSPKPGEESRSAGRSGPKPPQTENRPKRRGDASENGEPVDPLRGQKGAAPAEPTPLLAWLLESLKPMPRTRIKELLKNRRIVVNGKPETQFDRLVGPADRVEVLGRGLATDRAPGGLPILFADEFLIVVDKPAGLLAVATQKEKEQTAFALLNRHLEDKGKGKAYVVHRLDRDTSGLLVFARSMEMRDRLQGAWDQVKKTYLALVEGTPTRSEGVIENYLTEGEDMRVRQEQTGPESKWAITGYRTIGTVEEVSLIEVDLRTGRKHQIRVHLSGMDCPIVGDRVYGAETDPAGRLGLHSWKLKLKHPVKGTTMEWISPLPGALKVLVKGVKY